MEEKLRDLWNKTWKDKNGRIVLWQMPNRYLIGWAVFSILSLLVSGHLADIFSWASSAALLAWCYLEIFKGVNYFRRIMGFVVLVYAVSSLIKSF